MNSKPQICATIYDGQFDVSFDCPVLCAFAICSIMPPDGSEECCYRQNGTCRRILAQIVAIEELRRLLGHELRVRGGTMKDE